MRKSHIVPYIFIVAAALSLCFRAVLDLTEYCVIYAHILVSCSPKQRSFINKRESVLSCRALLYFILTATCDMLFV